ncbi:hypothetical protein H5410_055735 [Solanum commersonii]|uniref:Uncharacterized protein n=1 Tax=Solanum commersonii TaxID=4109 RepID=A0A9J5WID2_SOLCO|nr:hypothetical protein H5410_055735 [Solanum commersonii]
MRKILNRLSEIQNSLNYHRSLFLQNLESNLLERYDSLLKAKNDFEKVKSRINWLSEGYANTTFFHTSTINRQRRNKITSIKNEVGNLYENHESIQKHIFNLFVKLYTTSHTHSSKTDWIIPNRQNNLPIVALKALSDPLHDTEITKALHSFKPLKAPGQLAYTICSTRRIAPPMWQPNAPTYSRLRVPKPLGNTLGFPSSIEDPPT